METTSLNKSSLFVICGLWFLTEKKWTATKRLDLEEQSAKFHKKFPEFLNFNDCSILILMLHTHTHTLRGINIHIEVLPSSVSCVEQHLVTGCNNTADLHRADEQNGCLQIGSTLRVICSLTRCVCGRKREKRSFFVCVGGAGWACDSEFCETLEEEQWRERTV